MVKWIHSYTFNKLIQYKYISMYIYIYIYLLLFFKCSVRFHILRDLISSFFRFVCFFFNCSCDNFNNVIIDICMYSYWLFFFVVYCLTLKDFTSYAVHLSIELLINLQWYTVSFAYTNENRNMFIICMYVCVMKNIN